MTENIEYRVLQSESYNEMMNLLCKEFTENEPICDCLGCTKTALEVFMKPIAETGLQQKVCIGAFDKISGDICGVALNMVGNKKQSSMVPLEKQDLAIRQAATIIDCAFKGGCTEYFGTDNYMEMHMGGVKRKYGNCGIGTQLLKRSIDLAEQLECAYIINVCTSDYSRRASLNHGFEEKEKIFYNDYVDPLTGRKVFKDIPEPHTACVCLVKKL